MKIVIIIATILALVVVFSRRRGKSQAGSGSSEVDDLIAEAEFHIAYKKFTEAQKIVDAALVRFPEDPQLLALRKSLVERVPG